MFADSIDLFPLKKISAALYGSKPGAEDVSFESHPKASR
jgi:hypothetical protein